MPLSSGQFVSYQSILLPLDGLVLICIRIREAFDLSGLAAEQAVEVGSDLVALLCLQVMTLGASCLELVSLCGF